VRVADCSAVAPHNGARLHCCVKGRYISLLRWGGALHCLDSVCYHAGGPLTAGEIEELPNGVVCVLCPWHTYPVSIASGEKWYRATEKDADGKLVPTGWKSVGPRQRVHDVEERPVEGIFVRLRLDGAALESDSYAHNTVCGERCATSGPPPVTGRSGNVLKQSAALHSSRGADGKRLF
jgi:nitrite reductase/ring-hydroxylating ferredoxin subunit